MKTTHIQWFAQPSSRGRSFCFHNHPDRAFPIGRFPVIAKLIAVAH
jgi:hypothetical protein